MGGRVLLCLALVATLACAAATPDAPEPVAGAPAPALQQPIAKLDVALQEIVTSGAVGDEPIHVLVNGGAGLGDAVAAVGRVVFVGVGLAYVTLPPSALVDLAGAEAVESVEALSGIELREYERPLRPQTGPPFPLSRSDLFETDGLTGNGVVIGVVDTGIDWRHADFRNDDGSTRVLALWDQLDTGGSDLPAPLGLGTVYARPQINAALAGSGRCTSKDLYGHGTAVASVAAGNGRANRPLLPERQWRGIAPEADLLVVRAGNRTFGPEFLAGVAWIVAEARALQQPCVVVIPSIGDGGYADHPNRRFLEELSRAGWATIVAAPSVRDPLLPAVAPDSTSFITVVGSFDSRERWINGNGNLTHYELPIGELSPYGAESGWLPPDFVAPGRFGIGAIAEASLFATRTTAVDRTEDGFHGAWQGPESAVAYTAGVAALMLEKNHTLSGAAIRRLLTQSAGRDEVTGREPAPEWGSGKILPERALSRTPEVLR